MCVYIIKPFRHFRSLTTMILEQQCIGLCLKGASILQVGQKRTIGCNLRAMNRDVTFSCTYRSDQNRRTDSAVE